MDQTIPKFLTDNRVAILTVVLPNGTPHSAAMHFSHQETPLTLYFSGDKSQRKFEAFQTNSPAKASIVIGFSEEVWRTLQMEGTIEVVSDESKITTIKQIHYAKIPTSQQHENDPGLVFFAFTPNWWRYTDFITKPLTIIESGHE